MKKILCLTVLMVTLSSVSFCKVYRDNHDTGSAGKRATTRSHDTGSAGKVILVENYDFKN